VHVIAENNITTAIFVTFGNLLCDAAYITEMSAQSFGRSVIIATTIQKKNWTKDGYEKY
jgi:hypothetical protein